MKAFLIFFVALSVKYNAQAEKVFTVSEAAFLSIDSAKVDTGSQHFFTNMIDLPPGYTLISCEITFASHGEVFRTFYKRGTTSSYTQVKYFMDRAKPKDVISFDNIVVLKDGKTIRWKDKSVVMPGYTSTKN